jgi:hypothetical protein
MFFSTGPDTESPPIFRCRVPEAWNAGRLELAASSEKKKRKKKRVTQEHVCVRVSDVHDNIISLSDVD